MLDISALYVWNCLEQARNGENLYGGDVAEIYAQHLAPNEPVEDPWKHAGKALYALLRQFCNANRVSAFVDGRPIGDWMNNYKFFHKCDVRISNDEQRIDTGDGSATEVQQNSVGHLQVDSEESVENEGSDQILSPVFSHGQSKQTFEELENAIRQRYEEGKQSNNS